MSDAITEPQEWIDGLVLQYSPTAGDIDVALQNMGLRIAALEAQLAEARKLADGIHSYLDSHWCQCGELPEDQECYWHELFGFGKALSDAVAERPNSPPNSGAG